MKAPTLVLALLLLIGCEAASPPETVAAAAVGPKTSSLECAPHHAAECGCDQSPGERCDLQDGTWCTCAGERVWAECDPWSDPATWEGTCEAIHTSFKVVAPGRWLCATSGYCIPIN